MQLPKPFNRSALHREMRAVLSSTEPPWELTVMSHLIGVVWFLPKIVKLF